MADSPLAPDQRFPRFPREEYERRRTAVRELMEDADIDAFVIYGESGQLGSHHANVHYLTNYRGQAHVYVVFFRSPVEETTLLVGIRDCIPMAREWSVCEDVRWGGLDPMTQVIDRLSGTDAATGRIGIVGADSIFGFGLPHPHHEALEEALDATLVDQTGAYETLRTVKSDAEVEWIGRAAGFADAGVSAIETDGTAGVTERRLQASARRAVLEAGGEPHFTFLSSASMADPEPGKGLHWKQPSYRSLTDGDVINVELGADYWGYTAQLQRSFTVGTDPSGRYRELYDVAIETYDAVSDVLVPGNTVHDVLGAAGPIVESEYTIIDLLLHGYGTDIVAPMVSRRDIEAVRAGESLDREPVEFRDGMVVVLQPNPVTPDERYGVQFGNTVVIRENGPESLNDAPMSFAAV